MVGRRAHRQPYRRPLQQQIDAKQDEARDRDHTQVSIADEDAEHVCGVGREGTRKRPGHVPEDETGETIYQRRQAERDDDQGQDGSSLDRLNDQALDDDAPAEREDERDRKSDPVAHPSVDQRVRDERGEHGHLALREVDEAHRVVDQDECEREARKDAANCDPAHDLLEKLLHR